MLMDSKKPKSRVHFRRDVLFCPFDGKPCSRILLDGPACDGAWSFEVDGPQERIVERCPRFPKGSER